MLNTLETIRSAVVVLVVVLSIDARAQLLIGPKVGLGLSRFHYNNYPSSTSRFAGFTAGAQFQWTLINELLLVSELAYVQKGDRVDPYAGNYQNLVFNYVEVPLMLNYAFGKPEHARFFLGAGGSAARLVSARKRGMAVVSGVSRPFNFELDPEEKGINRTDLGACIGFGCVANMPNGAIRLELRSVFGLSDLNTEEDGTAAYNRHYQLALSVLFGGKRKPEVKAV